MAILPGWLLSKINNEFLYDSILQIEKQFSHKCPTSELKMSL